MKGPDIIAMRHGLGMSQRTLAKTLGVSKNTVSRWETGRSRIGPDSERKLLGLAGQEVQDGILTRQKKDLEIYEVTPEKVQQVFASIAFSATEKAKDRVAAPRELAKMLGMYSKVRKRTAYFHRNLAGKGDYEDVGTIGAQPSH